MPSIRKPQSIQAEDKMSEAYSLFFKLFLEKFRRASSIWWGAFIQIKGKQKGRSLHQEIESDFPKAIFQLTRGKPQRLANIMLLKLEAALVMWAIEKLGEDLEKRVNPALENFFTSVFLRMGMEARSDFLSAVHKSPFYIPVQLRKEAAVSQESLSNLKKEYETLLDLVKGIKNRTRREPSAQKMALIEKLPGTNTRMADKYQRMKPSQIALAYIAQKYRLAVSGEGLKKHLMQRIPQDVWDKEISRLKKGTEKIRQSLPQSI